MPPVASSPLALSSPSSTLKDPVTAGDPPVQSQIILLAYSRLISPFNSNYNRHRHGRVAEHIQGAGDWDMGILELFFHLLQRVINCGAHTAQVPASWSSEGRGR